MTTRIIRISDLVGSDTIRIGCFSDPGHSDIIPVGDNENEAHLMYSSYDHDLFEPYNVKYKWLSIKVVLVDRS